MQNEKVIDCSAVGYQYGCAGFLFQAFLFSDSEESNDSCDEDDDGYGDGYDMHDMVFCVCHPFG